MATIPPSEITRRVESLRQWMRQRGLSAFVIPSTDPHASEYVPDHWLTRQWISGFDGSAGTAVVTLAALVNALKLVDKKMSDIRVVMNGAGAAGVAIARLLLSVGVGDVLLCDRKGIICKETAGSNKEKLAMIEITNHEHRTGSLADAMRGADVFIGVSAPGVVTQDMIRTMAPKPVLFTMANPTPEIMPELALEVGAAVIGTGRSDYYNQINNVLAFPGIFRGALDVRASDINEEMKIAAAMALANLVSDEELNPEFIIPAAFDPRVCEHVSKAVAEAARKSGVARI